MATVIDALVVTLGMDLAGMKQGAGEANGVLEQLGKTAQKALAIIGGVALLKSAITNYLDAADAVGNFSRALGLDVEMVQMWGNMAQRAGGSADAMQGTIKTLTEEMVKLKAYGMSPTLGMWQATGVSMRDANGQIKTVDQMLLGLAERMEGMSAVRQDIIGKRLGLDEGTITLLQKGKKGLEEMLLRQKELGVYSKQDVELARKVKVAFADLKQAWDMTAAVAMRALVPAIQLVTDALTDVVLWVRQHKEFIYAFFISVATIVGAILVPMLEKMALGWWKAFAPIMPIVAVVAALGAAIALLYDDYAVWAEGGESLFGDAWADVEQFVNLSIDAFNQLGSILMALWEIVAPYFKAQLGNILDVVKGTFQVIAGMLAWLADLFTGNWEHMGESGMRVLEGLGNVAKGVFMGMVQPIIFIAQTIQRLLGAAIDWVLNKFAALGEKWESFKSAIGFGDDSSSAPQASAAQASSPAAIAGATNNKSVQSTTKIDNINVQTQATDAKGIAGDMGQAVQSQQMALAFDGGTF